MMEKIQYTQQTDSPLGSITMASDGEALTGLWFAGQKYFASTLGTLLQERRLPIFDEAKRWLEIYFQGRKPDFTPKLNPCGTTFRREVWNILLQIPYGTTLTYRAIGRQYALSHGLNHMSAQAIGGAVEHNPISLIIPCHRVVGSNGSLTGYVGGIDRKIALLRLEGAYPTQLFSPAETKW